MKRVVACLVLAVAVAGCGGDESGWQAEFRERVRQEVAEVSAIDPAAVLIVCESLATDYDNTAQLFIRNFEDAYRGRDSWWRLELVILPSYELEMTPSILDEAVRIFLDESEQVCP